MINKFFAWFILLIKYFISKIRFPTGPKSRLYNYIHNHIDNDQRVLNVGCGDGIFSELIRLNYSDICVYDVDVIDLRHNRKSPNFDLFDGYHLSQYDTGYFDVVLVIYVLHHVKHRNILLNEIMRVGKKILIVEDILNEPKATILDHFFTFTHRLWARFVCKDKEAYVQFWTKSKWSSTLDIYRANITYTNIPEKKWYHYVEHGMFLCSN
jgi:ubiquinone/menaquinone biosynthesis C-methylase UbiE